MAKPWFRVLSAVWRTAFTVLTCLSVAVLLLSLSLGCLYQPQPFKEAADGAFRAALYSEVQEHLQSEALFYGIPYEVLQPALTAEGLDKAVSARMDSIYPRLSGGEKLAPVAVGAAPFEAAVNADFAKVGS